MEGLDLSDNRLYNLDPVKELANYAPHIKHLKLSNNQVQYSVYRLVLSLDGYSQVVTRNATSSLL